jgi:hypothetical protein
MFMLVFLFDTVGHCIFIPFRFTVLDYLFSMFKFVLNLKHRNKSYSVYEFEFWCLTPLSAIFQLYHGDQFKWWWKTEYPERTNDSGQATGKLAAASRVYPFCNLQSWAQTHAILVIGLYELLDPTP